MGFAAAAPYVVPIATSVVGGMMGKKANKTKQTKPTFVYQPYTIIGKDGKEKLVPFYRLADAGGQSYSSGPNAMSIMGNAIQGAGDMYATGAFNDAREEAAHKRSMETINTWLGGSGSSSTPKYPPGFNPGKYDEV